MEFGATQIFVDLHGDTEDIYAEEVNDGIANCAKEQADAWRATAQEVIDEHNAQHPPSPSLPLCVRAFTTLVLTNHQFPPIATRSNFVLLAHSHHYLSDISRFFFFPYPPPHLTTRMTKLLLPSRL